MNFRKETAIFPSVDLDKVEHALICTGVLGMTVSTTHGFGEYRNYYARDTMTDCVRVEIFTEANKADEIAKVIARTVHQGRNSDGIIAVLPVENLLHIREFKEA
jgi:nitrogen regulatory protein P-II 1